MGFFSSIADAITGKSAKKAADDIVAATAAANQRLDEGLDFVRPNIEAGALGTQELLAALGLRGRDAQQSFEQSITDDPGFQANQDAGFEQISRNAAALGLRNSGGTLKDLATFNFRERDRFRNNRLTRLAGLADFGQGATNTFLSGTNQVANNIVAGGNAQAAGKIGQANVINSGISQAAQIGGRLLGLGF